MPITTSSREYPCEGVVLSQRKSTLCEDWVRGDRVGEFAVGERRRRGRRRAKDPNIAGLESAPAGPSGTNGLRHNSSIEVPAERCVDCDSADGVEPNPTNWPELYRCANCDRLINPATWPCPRCEKDDRVVRNPLDDPLEYACLDCEYVFPHPGPAFDPAEVVEGELAVADYGYRLSLDRQLIETEPTMVQRFALRNVGSDPVSMSGHEAIAVQARSDDGTWVTIYGNPDGHRPEERVELQPGLELAWKLGYHMGGLAVKDVFLWSGPLHVGEYRFVYWGLEATDAVIATRFSVAEYNKD